MTIRVALIDDHPSITWGLRCLIESESPRMQSVGEAHDLDSARQLLRQSAPDVVVLDLDLQGQSGAALIDEFLHTPMRFLVLSGLADRRVLDAAVLAGARGVVTKSEKPERILNAIRQVHAGELWMDRGRWGHLVDQLRKQGLARTPDAFAALTPREREIVAVIVELNGAPNRQIAERLGIGENTLRNALSSIYDKTGAGNRLQLFALAVKQGPRAPQL